MFERQTAGIRDLKLSVMEGAFAVILLTAGVSFIVPFAVFLGANSIEIGFLAAFPALFAAWVQLVSIKLLEKFSSRKKLVSTIVFIQAFMFLIIALIPFLFPTNGVFWLTLVYTFSIAVSSLGSPAWQSWMRSLIPDNIIGRYFGFRNSVVGFVAFIFLLIFGFSLKLFSANLGLVFIGIFLVSAFGRFMSFFMFTKMHEDTFKFSHEKGTGFLEFVTKITQTNFGHFLLYGALMSFGIALTGPFVSYYLLHSVGLVNDYFMYTLIISAAMVSTLISMPYWGKLIDKYGIVKVLKASSLLAAFFPLLYVVVRFPVGLIFVEFIDGLIFAGFNLALTSFIYDVSNQHKIVRYTTYQSIFFGSAIFLGAIISGYIQSFNFSFWLIPNSFLLLCVIAFVWRYLTYKLMIKKIEEVKQVEQISSKKIVFSILTFAPVTEKISETIVPFENGLKKAGLTFEERLKNLATAIEYGSHKFGTGVEKNFFKKKNMSETKKRKWEI